MKSLHGDTRELENGVTTCQLELFYIVRIEVVATLNEGLDEELKHNKDDLDDVTKMKNNNGPKTNNNTKAYEDKLAKILRPWEYMQLKRN